jgi:hypothetical protein
MPITDDEIEAVRAKHPGVDLYLLPHPTLPDADVVARRPTEAEWKHCLAMSEDPQRKPGVNGEMVNNCVLYPEPQQLSAIIKKYPALVGIWSGKIAELAGATEAMRTRKL